MHRLSRSRGDPQDAEKEQKPLSFRSVALLFPPKDVLGRVRTSNGDSTAAVNKPIDPLYDQDDDKAFPLSANEEPRIIIAQDDSGVSIDRLLYDSTWSQKSCKTKGEATIFSRPSSSSPKSLTGSGFIPNQQSRPERPSQPPLAASAFAPFSPRRTPASTSLADARNDSALPIEGTSDELDSWLDCMFAKAPMRYKGAVTKLHHLQRQPADPLLPHWQSGSFGPERNNSLPASRPEDLAKLRKDALLISTTFAVNIHDEDLPEPPQSGTSPDARISPSHKQLGGRRKRFNTPMFGVAILLPLATPRICNPAHQNEPQDQVDEEGDPAQAVIDNWHVYARALNALKTTASLHIQQKLRANLAEAQARLYAVPSPAGPRLVKLDPHAFANTPDIVQTSLAVVDRISRSSKILRVNPQGEWNIWRDELRDFVRVNQDADPKRGLFNASKIAFVQTCLTAALSVGLGWLHIFAPPQHQNRLREERRQGQSSLDMAQNRTVVVTLDQNKARDLVFIFAKLFPQSQSLVQFARSRRSSQNSMTSSSERVSAITQGLEAEKHLSTNGHTSGRANDFSNSQFLPASAIFEPPYQIQSKISPVKRTMNEPNSELARKPGVAKDGRIDIPGKATPAVPVSAPGSSRTTPAGSPEVRPGSSASAHGELMRNLQRSSSTTTSNGSTDTGSIWSSFRSNSWSLKPRRESSTTERSDSGGSNTHREQQPAGILKTSKSASTRHGSSKLVRMVEDPAPSQNDGRKDSAMNLRDSTSFSSNGVAQKTAVLQFNPPSPDISDISYTYNQDEGVVDVDFPGCMPSPNSSRILSNRATRRKVPSAKHHFPNSNTPGQTSNKSPNHRPSEFPAEYDRAAGYLEKFHPDFALQATKPYAELVDEIKLAMRAEPSPRMEPPANLKIFSHETWIDVCSTVIVDAEALVVKRVTLRRHVRYKLIAIDESPNLLRQSAVVNGKERPTTSSDDKHTSDTGSKIKITKSEDMQPIKRTYKRNDQGQKVAFRDQKVRKSDVGNGSVTGGETYNSLPDQRIIKAVGNGLSQSPESFNSHNLINPTRGEAKKPIATSSNNGHTEPNGKRSNSITLGDDLSEFIDKKTANPAVPAAIATKRVMIKNKEGKITGWKDVEVDTPDEAGLNDLPTGFVEKRNDKAAPVVECQMLAETFDEEIITKPDSAIVNLLQQMVATSESRSRAHSRANSLHSRAPSRSNSISGSGLSELQYESKKIIENSLEGLVSAMASDRYLSTSTSSGGLFGFGRTASSTPELSILRQSITKWMYAEA